MSNNQSKLFFGRPIPLNDEVSIIQPKMSEIIDMGELYDSYLLPFTVTLETIFDDEQAIEQLNLFELFFEKVEGEYVLTNVFNGSPIKRLCDSIEFFTGCEVQVLEHRKKIAIGKSYLLDKNNFTHFRKIIQSVSTRKDLVVEKMPKGLSERRKDIWIKLHEGRKRKAEREAMSIEDIANAISFGGKGHIPFDSILNMTYYQFVNAYKTVMSIDAFTIGLEYKVSQKYDYKDELPHWTKNIKIINELD